MSSRAPALHRAGAASVVELPWQHGDLALMRGRLRLATRARSSTTIVLPAAATRIDAATSPHAPLDDGRHDNGCDIVVSRDGRAIRVAPLSAERAQTDRSLQAPPSALPWQPNAPHASPLRTATTAAATAASGAPKNALAGRRRGELSAHSSLLSWQQQQQQLLLQDAGADAPGALAAASGKARRVGGADFNYDLCCACGGGGELVCCESCPNAFHFDCTVPALDRDNLPDGDWFCRQCVAKQASKSAPPPTTSVFAAVVGAFSAVNPIEYTVPHELADLQLTLTGRSDTSRQAAATVMGADGDLLAKDRDLCVVCELPFECDNSIGPAHRFSVPSLAAGGAVAAAAAAAAATAAATTTTRTTTSASTAAAAPSSSSSLSDAAAPPSALGLAFLGELDPYRSTDSTPRGNCGDKRKCTWCDDCYHVYCVRPASDPRLPPPPHWLCPRHFREADSNYAQQKLSKKVHALQQDPKWHRDYQAQRETQARGSAVPLLFSAVKPTSALRSAAPQPSESALGDNVRRTFVSAREQLIDADIASRPIADLRRDVERVGEQIKRVTEAAFPPAMAVEVPDDARLLVNAATADVRNAALPPELEAANAAGTTATAVVAAASAVAKRSAARKRTFDATNADANDNDDDDDDDGDTRSRTAVASLLALFAADGVDDNNNNNDDDDEDDNDSDNNDSDKNDAAVPDFETDRRSLARLLLADEIEADVCERLSPTFVQFLAWQQLQLLHAKHKDGLYDLRRKEMKTSTVTNASTHAAPRSQSASRRSAVAPVGLQSTAAMMTVGGNRQLETRKKKSGLTRSACDWCYIKHYECRVSQEGASCLRCVAAGQRCSLLDRSNGELTPAPATATAPLSSSGRQQRRRTLTDVSGPSDDSPPPPPKQTDGVDESPPQQQQQQQQPLPPPQKQQESLQAMPFDVTEVSDDTADDVDDGNPVALLPPQN
jgi:hypothetical protein